MKTILVKTNNDGFIKIEVKENEILTSMASNEDIPERIENLTAGCGGLKALHPHLVNEARQLAACYSEELMNPLTAFLVKTGSGEIDWADVEMDS